MLVVNIARWIVVWFGGLSFVLLFIKEEVLRAVAKSQLGQAQYKRRFLLVGTPDDTARMRAEIDGKSEQENIEVVGELSLSDTPIEQLVHMLHEHSVNGVILNARHAYFEQVEIAIRACELEGVEAWLIADFFKTQISRTTVDDFYGRPIMVFRTTDRKSTR